MATQLIRLLTRVLYKSTSITDMAYIDMAYILSSYGEIVDKYTILEIKLENIMDVNKREHILKDLAALAPTVNELLKSGGIVDWYRDLKTVNQTLWLIEDRIRVKERLSEFDEDFIALARSVYLKNDERAQLKYTINKLTHSHLSEEKSYYA